MDSADKLPSHSVLAEAGADCRRKSQLFAETLDPIFRTTMETPEHLGDFRAGLSTYFMGPALFLVADMLGTTYTFSRDPGRIARSGLDLIFVQLTLEGSDMRILGGETLTVEAGDISLFDLSRPMHAETSHCRNATTLVKALLDALEDPALDEQARRERVAAVAAYLDLLRADPTGGMLDLPLDVRPAQRGNGPGRSRGR